VAQSKSGVAALGMLAIFVHGPALSATMACRADPYKCTAQELCSNDILGKYGELSYSYKEHAKYAQKLGLSCAPKKATQPKSVANPLRDGFIKLSSDNRKLVQTNLTALGFYSSFIDGYFGKATQKGLELYNKNYLKNSSIAERGNIDALYASILAHPIPKNNRLKPDAVQLQPAEQDTLERGIPLYEIGTGTGFFISAHGHIVTNQHVIDNCNQIIVTSEMSDFASKTIAEDRTNDLALLKIDKLPKHFFALSTESPFPLQEVVVAGFPFGKDVSSTIKFTRGVVSSMAGLGNNYSQIQVDAAMQPGNSGGPILDDQGNVIAVSVAKLNLRTSIEAYGVVPENTNFGVKSSVVRSLLDSNNVGVKEPYIENITARSIAEQATLGTVLLTCLMTQERIEQIAK
jgi:S1-C subfamily serine protease